MSYNDIAAIARDIDLRTRVAACAATEGDASPWLWVDRQMWKVAAQPGWGAAYASAVASGVAQPGRDESVITDAMILAAVQAMRATDTLVPEEG